MKILPITVLPNLPDRLKPLQEMAENIWFSWHPELLLLFRQMSQELWQLTGHNPVKILAELDQDRIEELLSDEGFLDGMDSVYKKFQRYMKEQASYDFHLEEPADYTIAYFSTEYGLTECLPIYSGGLGVLSGDHLKSASDIRIPLVAVGLLYQEGYFKQRLNSQGWQEEQYPDNDFYVLPSSPVLDANGEPETIEILVGERSVKVHIWRVKVGRVDLYLLDTNLAENHPDDRKITGQLYGGDREMRLKQEIVLGIGGVRALHHLDIHPAVYHMNEGHSAFATLERANILMKKGLSFTAAKNYIRATSVFTTHTPVPAGNDYFAPDLMIRYFRKYCEEIGIDLAQLLSLGRINPEDKNEYFCMTVFALRLSLWCNGVSKIHARVSKNMWKGIWPDVPFDEIPIKPLTNGVHIPSWISYEIGLLYDRYLGPRWSEDPDNQKVWEKSLTIPDTELWRTHERRRERLVSFARRRLAWQRMRRGAAPSAVEESRTVLHPEALTIGFARRFATYKRAILIFRDPERLARILNDPERPVQIIFAGKAHPADERGKEFIQQIIRYSEDPRFRNRVVFLEDYDMNVARYLVQGADVWLNNPRRPLEACGTSGMKAAANGAINLSVLDGWWAEGYSPDNGWAIGRGEEYQDEDYADEVEARAIYDLLEKEVIPTFYQLSEDGLPHAWIARMKNGLKNVCPFFNTHRMVEDYMEMFYNPAALLGKRLRQNDYQDLNAMTEWLDRVRSVWPNVVVREIHVSPEKEVSVYSELTVEAVVDAAGLAPAEIDVQAYYGRLNTAGEFEESWKDSLEFVEERDGALLFRGTVKCRRTGRGGVTVRVLPKHELLLNPLHLNLVRWA
ncbi:MAG: glycosyltransferase family 1 protein [Candidatus Hydrogenedentota bacterium]|nr:MAG: glycosyltransferase family 1 protein [Candidatus Hydrogenedentota bacterium]